MNLVSEKLSLKIKQVLFLMSFFVVVQHSINAPGISYDNFSSSPFNIEVAIQFFIGLQLVTVSNPLFFLISGYLFFRNIDIKSIWSKWKKRFYSLVVPYLIATICAILFTPPLFKLTNGQIYKIDPGFTNWNTFQEFLNILTRGGITYQLWFIRDLIVYILLAPLLYFLLKKLPKLTLFTFFLIWVMDFKVGIVSTDNLIFFPLGAYLALNSYKLSTKPNTKYLIIASIIWLILMQMKLYLSFSHLGKTYYLILLHRAALIFGMYSVWKFFDYVKYSQKLLSFTRFAFFVYLFHLPYIYFVEYLVDLASLSLPGQATIRFVLTPIITFLSLVSIGKGLSKLNPKLYRVISGNR